MAEIDNLVIRITADSGEATSSINSLAAALNNLKATTRSGAKGLENYAKAIEKLKKAADGASAAMPEIAAPAAGGIPKEVQAQLKEQEKQIQRLSKAVKDTAEEIQGFGSGEGEGAEETEKFNLSLKGLAKTFARIGKMMLIRTAIREAVSALKEGISNLYQYSKMNEGTFAAAMDKASSATLYLKNSIAAGLSPVIAALARGFAVVARAIGLAFNILKAFIALIVGYKGDMTFAKWDVFDDFEAGANKASKAAKQLRDLLGFDEINRLSAPNSGAGSAGATISALTDMFEKMSASEYLDSIWDKFLNKGKSVFEQLAEASDEAESDVRRKWHNNLMPLLTTDAETIKQRWSEAWDTAKQKSAEAEEDTRRRWHANFIPLFSTDAATIKQRWSEAWDLAKKKSKEAEDDTRRGWHANLIPLLSTDAGTIKQKWADAWENIRKKAEEKVEKIKKKWAEIKESVLALPKTVQDAWNKVMNGSAQTLESVSLKISRLINKYVIDPINKIIDTINKVLGLNWSRLTRLNTNSGGSGGGGGTGGGNGYAYAAGGWPSMGQVFVAREAGPEMVGTIGSRTAVATNNDIVAAVAQGVASAVASVMGSTGGQNISVNVDGRALFDIMVNQNNTIVRQRGASPLLV